MIDDAVENPQQSVSESVTILVAVLHHLFFELLVGAGQSGRTFLTEIHWL